MKWRLGSPGRERSRHHLPVSRNEQGPSSTNPAVTQREPADLIPSRYGYLDNHYIRNYNDRVRRRLDPDLLKPSGTILTTQLGLAAEIEARVAGIGQHPTVLDLLVRLDLAADRTERASRLCNQLNLSAAHMSRTIDRAEVAGLVERRPDPKDRRAQVIVLTADGDALLADFAPRLHDLLRTVIHDVLSREEVTALIASLERIQRACNNLAENDLEESTHA